MKHSQQELIQKAYEIRKDIIDMLLAAGSGHSAGPLGLADIFTALYFEVLNHDPKNPDWIERDKVVVSNGHVCPVWYATLANAGYFPKEWLKTLRKLNSKLQGHPNRLDTPGVENSSGPLGQGFSQAIGMALADQLDGRKCQTYVFLGDGELDEGQCWEAIMFAAGKKMSHLTAIVDRNNIQIDGHTEDVMPLENLAEKFEAFNWDVQEIDGHNIDSIVDALNRAKTVWGKPSVIIANTVPGKGVDFMEWKPEWHGKPPNEEEASESRRELKNEMERLRTLKGNINYE
ncbi:transketolase [Candidatus Dojkabacteria bacterium]|uniref:Transketolase n=1 Tax=Candidatus Dojkabacteria bacterium TaxID=2099670 RepID=A0A955RLM9_9BACT|nr:transketolase [Candidatus Dojkabacteria bacterium]